ncbi:MAG: YfhO family protein [Chloroflexi bacterium]|nr:YfhO family protein [Chloroflexota bacterium]
MQIGTDDDGRVAFRTAYLPRPNLVFEDGKSQIYRRSGTFERAYFVPQALVVENVAEGHTAVLAHADDLDQLVILELMGQAPPPGLGQPANAAANIAITDYGLNQVTITAVTDTDGFLVLSDTYYPGWRATLDGQATPVYQANTLVRAIYLPAGAHTAVFTFRPPDFIFAAAVSALTLLASLIALVILRRK